MDSNDNNDNDNKNKYFESLLCLSIVLGFKYVKLFNFYNYFMLRVLYYFLFDRRGIEVIELGFWCMLFYLKFGFLLRY